MQYGYSQVCLAHDTGTRHPESADRLRAIRRGLQGAHGVEYVEAPAVDVETLAAVHDPEYLESVREFCADGGGVWDADTVAVEATWDAVRQSAGLARWTAERALAGDDGRATPFSIGRPPGHHALADDAMGFCFVNNVAVAAQAALDGDAADGNDDSDGRNDDGAGGNGEVDGGDVDGANGDVNGANGDGDGAKGDGDGDAGDHAGPNGGADLPDGGCDTVAVVDWDVHPGNGTQELFYERDDVLVASIHEQGIYPGTGAREEVGARDGVGWTLNVPLPPESGDAAYETAFRDLVRPAVLDADPDLVLVSAGFDAHEADPISTMELTTEGYGVLAEQVRDLAADADAGLGFVLEGGYGLEELAESVRTVHEVFDGYAPEAAEGDAAEAARSRIDAVADVHPRLDGEGGSDREA